MAGWNAYKSTLDIYLNSVDLSIDSYLKQEENVEEPVSGMVFDLTEKQMKKVKEWEKDQNAITLSHEKQTINKNHPNYFAYQQNWAIDFPLNCDLKYMFTPTGIGNIVKVEHSGTKSVIDITDYDNF